MKGLWWLLRRLILPAAIATLAGRLAFVIFVTGYTGIANIFADAEDARVTFGLIAVILIAVVIAAYLLRRLDWHAAWRVVTLLAFSAAAGFVLIYLLTEVVAYALLVMSPAIVSAIVWLLCNIDLLKRSKKEPTLG